MPGQSLVEMILLDIVLLILLGGFTFYGLFKGLIRLVASIFGVLLGAWLASRFYLLLFYFIGGIFGKYENLGKIACFVAIFLTINRLTIFFFEFIERTLGAISIIPFMNSANRLAGAVFGFLEGALISAVIIFVISKYTFLDTLVGKWIAGSKIVPMLMQIMKMMMPFISDTLIKIKGLFDY